MISQSGSSSKLNSIENWIPFEKKESTSPTSPWILPLAHSVGLASFFSAWCDLFVDELPRPPQTPSSCGPVVLQKRWGYIPRRESFQGPSLMYLSSCYHKRKAWPFVTICDPSSHAPNMIKVHMRWRLLHQKLCQVILDATTRPRSCSKPIRKYDEVMSNTPASVH